MKGFTLIELLAVVMIIGILAAIALPQYTKAIEKSRATEALIVTKALQDAMQRHVQEFPGDIPNTQKQIADVKLTNGEWVGASSKGDSSCFITKTFAYDISTPTITAHRKDGVIGCSSATSGAKYYVELYKIVPDNVKSRVIGFHGGSEYDSVRALFEN